MKKFAIFPVTSTPLEKLALCCHFHSFLRFNLPIHFKEFNEIPILSVVLIELASLFDFLFFRSSFALWVIACLKLEDIRSQQRFRPVQDVLRPFLFILYTHLKSYLARQDFLRSLLIPLFVLIFLGFSAFSSGLHLIESNTQEYEEVCLGLVEDEDRLAFLKIKCS